MCCINSHQHTQDSPYCFLSDSAALQSLSVLRPSEEAALVLHGALKSRSLSVLLTLLNACFLLPLFVDLVTELLLLCPVVSVCQSFAVLEDGAMAHNLQEQESKYNVKLPRVSVESTSVSLSLHLLCCEASSLVIQCKS